MTAGRKMRMTPQRQVILDMVRALDSHPTADEIYARVKKKLPRISMGTVYRNLDILASCGLISRLEPSQTQMRFDCNTNDHYHVNCVRCGCIEDEPVKPADDTFETLQNALGNLTKYGIFGHRLEFFGLCSRCRAQEPELGEKERQARVLESFRKKEEG